MLKSVITISCRIELKRASGVFALSFGGGGVQTKIFRKMSI